jgi:predicted TIM-barrel fold metal-dependent hydrolase/pimeloyl-ACP methyl ester carboxylesterase
MLSRMGFAGIALAALAQATGAPPGPAPFFDHHAHVLGPGLVRDWSSQGATFSRPAEAYGSAGALLEGGDEALAGAALVPMAHLYGNAAFRTALGLSAEEELARVRAENDHAALEAARHRGRTVALAAVDLLRPYALDELARARREHAVAGAKLHLASAGLDFQDDAHLAALERVVAWAEDEGAWLLLHLDPQRSGVGVEDVRQLLARAFGPHPHARAVIAHLGGSGGFGPWTRAVLATCTAWLEAERAARRPRPAFLLDLAAVPMLRESEGTPASSAEELAALAPALRALGMERIVFGSDWPVFEPREHARFLAERCGLTPGELDRIRRNRAFHTALPGSLHPESVSFPTADGGRIEADAYGSGTHAVVLAHGGRFDKESWADQARALAETGFRVLALDFRGHGGSRGPGAEDPLAAPLHEDVLAAVRHLRAGGARTVSVIGASMGGSAAAEASAAGGPGAIDRLVVLGAPPGSRPEELRSRLLVVAARDDVGPLDRPRLPAILAAYERAPEPKELRLVDGAAHAQFLFQSDQAAAVMEAVQSFLAAP